MHTRVGTDQRRRTSTYAAVICGATFSVLLAACSGSTGGQGPAGAAGATGPTGPAGPTGPVTGLNVTSATAITGTITSVTVGSGQPVVDFQLVDENGAPLSGLPAADIGFAIAKLTPGTNGTSSYWTSYIYQTVTPSGCPTGVTSCDTAPAIQPATESGTTGKLVDNGNGTYVYTFAKNITTDPLVTYVATLTHRVAFEIRGLAQANNGAYTFQPSTGATTNIFSREIVETSTCDTCHGFLNAHGGARVEVHYCVMCHSPQNSDPYSGNTLDFKRMIHKIHTGINLPSINPPALAAVDTTPTLGQGYWIVGYMESLNNFNTVLFPQDTRNCQTCHVQNLAGATEAGNYASVPTMEACGACHDNVNFATGANHSTNIVANDTQCVTCHGPSSNLDNGQLTAVAAHTIPDVVAAALYQFSVNSVTFSVQAGSTYPVVNLSVTNPNNHQPYNILADPTFVGNGIIAGQTFNGVTPTGVTTPV
ncbi:MAG: OmcA/MtrC family decaheme c-type cytochrome, partial [Steroidobacteraceae bacterium]